MCTIVWRPSSWLSTFSGSVLSHCSNASGVWCERYNVYILAVVFIYRRAESDVQVGLQIVAPFGKTSLEGINPCYCMSIDIEQRNRRTCWVPRPGNNNIERSFAGLPLALRSMGGRSPTDAI